MSKKISELTAVAAAAAYLLEASRLSSTVTITASTISAQASDNSFNDSGGGFLAAGFAVGKSVKVVGFTGNVANNLGSGRITVLTPAKMTIGGADGDVIVDDAAGESVTITAWESVRITAQGIIDLVLDAPPGALDTLNELAAALNDDANFATTVTNALALKAPLASPALTGNPTVPTQSPGDNSTKAASTAYVEAAVAAGGGGGGAVETSVPIARRYRAGDGMWREVMRIGDGDLTAGTPADVLNNSAYNGWPGGDRMRDARLFAVWTAGTEHHGSNTGKIVAAIATEALDGTLTWGTPYDIYDTANWSTAMGVRVLDNGRIIVAFFEHAWPAQVDGVYLIYSDDDGATWSARVTATSSLTDFAYAGSAPVQLPDGSLLLPIEGMNSGDTDSRARVLKSTDRGLTWGDEVEVASSQGVRPYYEPVLVVLDNGVVQCHMRTGENDGDIYISESTDFGATWGTPFVGYPHHGQPNVRQLSSGTLIAIGRKNEGVPGTGDCVAFASTDRGITWGSPLTIDSSMYEMEYGCPVEALEGGKVHVIYGAQPSSALTNSDIKHCLLSEGRVALEDLGGGSGGTLVGKTVEASYTRPADTTTYAGGDVLAESTSAATILTFAGIAAANGGSFILTHALLIDSVAQSLKPDIDLYLFKGSITMQNDNAGWNPSDADMEKLLAKVSFYGAAFAVGNGNGSIAGELAGAKLLTCDSGVDDVYGIAIVRNVYIPASGEKFTFKLGVIQL
jgi:hypothetical protein